MYITLCYVSDSAKVGMQLLEVSEGATLSYVLAMPETVDFVSSNAIGINCKVGIFSHIVKKPEQQVLQNGDRDEWYRPLLLDPMLKRKQKAMRVKKAVN